MSIEQYPPSNGVLTSLIWRKTAVGGETTLSGYDNGNQALSYTPGQEQVYLNGILLVRAEDYTATNGTSISGLSALTAGDYIQINCYNNFSVATIPATSITGTISNTQLTSASTSSVGIVQLTDSTSSTSTTTAATPNSVKSAYDLANGAIPKTLTTTTGDIIYASSANTPDRLGIGSSGNVLTVSGGLPVWSAPASSGGMDLLSTTTLTGASIVYVSNISQNYKELVVNISGVTSASDSQGVLFFWPMNDDTYAEGSAFANENFTDPMAWYNRPSIVRLTDDRNSGTALRHNNANNVFTIRILNYASTDSYKSFIQYGIYVNENDANKPNFMAGGYTTNIAFNKLYIGTQSNWTGGTVRVYGVK